MTEEEKYRFGMASGEVFAEKVDALFKDFAQAYETAEVNFKDEDYKDGFWKGFIDNVSLVVD